MQEEHFTASMFEQYICGLFWHSYSFHSLGHNMQFTAHILTLKKNDTKKTFMINWNLDESVVKK